MSRFDLRGVVFLAAIGTSCATDSTSTGTERDVGEPNADEAGATVLDGTAGAEGMETDPMTALGEGGKPLPAASPLPAPPESSAEADPIPETPSGSGPDSGAVEPIADGGGGATNGPTSFQPGSYTLENCSDITLRLFDTGAGLFTMAFGVLPEESGVIDVDAALSEGRLTLDQQGRTIATSVSYWMQGSPNCGQAFPSPAELVTCDSPLVPDRVPPRLRPAVGRQPPWDVRVVSSEALDAEAWIDRLTLRGPEDVPASWRALPIDAPGTETVATELALEVDDWRALTAGPWQVDVPAGLADVADNAAVGFTLDLGVIDLGAPVERITAQTVASTDGFDPVGMAFLDEAGNPVCDDCLYASNMNGPGGAPRGWLAGRIATSGNAQLAVVWLGAVTEEDGFEMTVVTPDGTLTTTPLIANGAGWQETVVDVPEATEVGVMLSLASDNCDLFQVLVDFIEPR